MSTPGRNPQVGGGGTTNITNNYEIISGTNTIVADATAGEVEVTLPDAAANTNSTNTVVKSDSSTNIVKVTGADTIYGKFTLNKQWEWVSFTSDGTNWYQTNQQESQISVKVFGATGDGTTDDRGAINTAVSAANGATILFPSGTYKISSNLSIVEGAEFQRGATLSIDSGVTVTFSDIIQAGRYQIFSGDGTALITGTGNEYVYPEWWGGFADGSTDVTTMIQAALDSGDIPVSLANGIYIVTAVINLDSDDSIVGQGTGSVIQIESVASPAIRVFQSKYDAGGLGYRIENVSLRNFKIDGSGSVRTDAGSSVPAVILYNTDNVLIENVYFYDLHQGAIELAADSTVDDGPCSNARILNNTIDTVGYETAQAPEAIFVSSGRHILVQGNYIKNAQQFAGISMETSTWGLHDVKIKGNTVIDCDDIGIKVKAASLGGERDNTDHILIADNSVFVGEMGIQVQSGANLHYARDITISGNMVIAGTTLYRGRTDTNVGHGGFSYFISDTKYWVDENFTGVSLPAGDIPAGLWGVYGFEIGADGTVDVTGDTNSGVGYATEPLAIAALPPESASHVQFGYITVQAPAGGAFTPGTTNLADGGATEAQATHYYWLPISDDSGIQGANMTVYNNQIRGFNRGIYMIHGSDAHNNYIEACGTGIEVGGAASSYPPFNPANTSYSVIGNHVIDSVNIGGTSYGIYIGGNSVKVNLADNFVECRNPGLITDYGIFSTGSSQEIYYIGNVINDCTDNLSISRANTGDEYFNGNVGFGAESPGARINLIESTDSTDGIWFGDDVKLFRISEGRLQLRDNMLFGSTATTGETNVTLQSQSEHDTAITFLEGTNNGAIFRYDGGTNTFSIVALNSGVESSVLSFVRGTQAVTIAQNLSVGADKFNIDANGNITKLNNVTTTFPSSNSAGVLTNNGSGTLTWASVSGGGDTTIMLPVSQFVSAPDGGSNAITVTLAQDRTNYRSYMRFTGLSNTQDMDMDCESRLSSSYSAFTGSNSLSIDVRASDYANCQVLLTLMDADGNVDSTIDGTYDITPSANNTWQTKTVEPGSSYVANEGIIVRVRVVSLDTADTVDIARVKLSYDV